MKKILLTLCFVLLSCSLAACAGNSVQQSDFVAPGAQAVAHNSQTLGGMTAVDTTQKIVLTIDGQQVVVRLYDNPAARDLLAMLPLTLTFKDYVASEKNSLFAAQADCTSCGYSY